MNIPQQAAWTIYELGLSGQGGDIVVERDGGYAGMCGRLLWSGE